VNGIALGVVVVGESRAVEEYIEPLAEQVDWLPDPRRPLRRRDALWASELLEVVNERVEARAVHRGGAVASASAWGGFGPTRAIDLPTAALERGNEVRALARPSLRLGLNRHGCLRRLEHALGRCPRRHSPRAALGLRHHRVDREPVPSGQDRGALDYTRKLAYVAGPLVR